MHAAIERTGGVDLGQTSLAPKRGTLDHVALRVLLAVNTRARRGRDGRDRAVDALRSRGHEVIVADTRSATDLELTLVRSAGRIDVAAIGGGDGTLISAIGGLRRIGVPMLILPLGTINELARTLAIPATIEGACDLLDSGETHAIDVGCVNGFWFFNEASIGLSTHVAREQTGAVKSRWGMFAIPLATARAWRSLRPYHLDVELETGERTAFRTMQLTVANSYRFGGIVENTEARIDDGTLDLYSIELRHWWDPLEIIGAVALKRFPDARGVQTIRGRRFVVRGRHRHHVFADGEPATRTPAEFTVVPRAITVYVPRP
jgi:YegS/Rv2252/BmrU family lipid kinase